MSRLRKKELSKEYTPRQQFMGPGSADLEIPKRLLKPKSRAHVVRNAVLRAMAWTLAGVLICLFLADTIFPYVFLIVCAMACILMNLCTFLSNAYIGLFWKKKVSPEVMRHIQTVLSTRAFELAYYIVLYPVILFVFIRGGLWT